jgi:hypothetical protein
MSCLRFKFDTFIVGFPYGLLGKIYNVEDGIGKYTLWDRVRYRVLIGKKLL